MLESLKLLLHSHAAFWIGYKRLEALQIELAKGHTSLCSFISY